MRLPGLQAALVVQKAGHLIRCEPRMLKTGFAVWKCGACRHGVVDFEQGSQCRVCGAVVVELITRRIS